MSGKPRYVAAKALGKPGCIAYPCKDEREARCLFGVLAAVCAIGVEIGLLDRPGGVRRKRAVPIHC